MRKVIKINLAAIWVLAVIWMLLSLFVPSISTWMAPYFKIVASVVAGLTIIWIAILGVMLFRFEVGMTIDGTVKYRPDEKPKRIPVDDETTDDIYTELEKAEFSPKVKPEYNKVVLAHPQPIEEEVVEEVKPEVVEEVKAPETVEEKVVEEVKVEPVKEEPKVVEPVEEVKEEPKALIPLATKKAVAFQLWEGNNVFVSEGWVDYLKVESSKPYYKKMIEFVKDVYDAEKLCYPSKNDIFKCFEYTDLENVRVVIIGKIPFYRKNQADGLAFSTSKEQSPNQTTTVIINEAVSDVGIKKPENGSLEAWAREGVLLLNSTMTAPADKPASHSECGWPTFTNSIIEMLIKDSKPKVFVLWGEHARDFIPLVEKNKAHMAIVAPNPSPLSAANGFYGSKPFSKINEFLVKNGYTPINWEL